MMRKTVGLFVLLGSCTGIGYFGWRSMPPEAKNDQVSTSESRPVTVEVLKNDRDPKGDPLHLVHVDPPANGQARISDDRKTIIYAPNAGFLGKDTFAYRITDQGRHEVGAKVTVDVAFSPPDFHRRSKAASLSEMMQEPPSSVYGSTINVFLFRDGQQRLREITISGHADSLTCASTSGAFADALISSGASQNDFLLAGAGRMVVPLPDPERTLALERDPAVREHQQLSSMLAFVRLMWQNKKMGDEDVVKFIGMPMRDAEKKLATLSTNPAVKEYLATSRAAESAAAFVRQAVDMQKMSGLLRIHEVDHASIAAVHDRLSRAAKAGGAQVIKFDDIAPAAGNEAVVYAPMLLEGSGEPVEISVPVGEFSPEGFRRAAKVYRSALENAVIGSAERRLAHAQSFLKDAERDQGRCEKMSKSELERHVSGLSTCDRDGCRPDPSAKRITYRAYCSANVPANLKVGVEWRDDAQQIISRIKTMSERQDVNRLDSLNYAALIDSMLRNWALSFSRAQPAFDEWRTNGRGRAWQTITLAAQKRGIGRAALSGESVVFNVRLEGETITIRPMLVVDLKRTVVVLDPTLNVTAAVSPWELRSVTADHRVLPTSQDPLAALSQAPAELARRLESEPRGEMSVLIERLIAQLPPEGDVHKQHAARARLNWTRQVEEHLRPQLNKMLSAPVEDRDEAWKQLVGLQVVIYTARHMPEVSAEFRMHAALTVFQRYSVYAGEPLPPSWAGLALSLSNPSRDPIPSRAERILFGERAKDFFTKVVAEARRLDGKLVEKLLDQRGAATAMHETVAPLSVETILTRVAGETERARSVLALQQLVHEALAAYNPDGSVSTRALERIIAPPLTEAGAVYHGRMWGELQQVLHYFAAQASVDGNLNPIEGEKFAVELHRMMTQLDAELRSLKPLLSVVRLGREQDVIIARMLFDEGNYQEAYNRLAPARSPLALFSPELSWTVIAPDLKGVPSAIVLEDKAPSVIVAAQIGSERRDVLRLDGLSSEDRKSLVSAQPAPILDWNEGNPLWEQLLLATVPSRGTIQEFAKALKHDTLHLTALKAMVYACAAPGAHILKAGGRCEKAEGSTALHDRVQVSDRAQFDAPQATRFVEFALQRFKRERAWQFAMEAAK